MRSSRFLFLMCLGASALLTSGCTEDDAAAAVAVEDNTTAPDNTTATDNETVVDAPLEFCAGQTTFLYDPLNTDFLGAFPDDYFTADDPGTPTGLRVNFTETNTGWTQDIPDNFRPNIFELNDLDGWGTTAGIFLRFSEKLKTDWPSGEGSLDDDAVRLLRLEADGTVTDIAFTVTYVDDDTTAIVVPMVPLQPKTLHALLVTTDVVGDDGDCIAPSPALKGLLTAAANAPGLQRLVPAYQAILEATDLRADAISAAAVFTTQSIVDGDLAAAADIAERSFAWSGDGPTCTEQADVMKCEGRFVGSDYRDGNEVFVDGKPQDSWEYPVSVWLPKTGTGPLPTLIFGHGIGGDRSQAGFLAPIVADLGFVVIAMDAVAHAQHPGGSGGGGQGDVLRFFGINIAIFGLDGLKLRDNWRQSAFDKLQLVKLMHDDPDIDGDGAPDLDVDRIAYMGVSLGGIMGPALLALSDRIGAGILDVCGGRLSQIITDSSDFSGLVAIAAGGSTAGDQARFFQMAQTLIERGDPANFAPYLLRNRLPSTGDRLPNVLMQIAMGDTTIPNSTSWYLAQSMDLPQLAPVVTPIPLVQQDAVLPLSANVSADVTGGIFQFDRVSYQQGGPVQAAGHGSTPGSLESVNQAMNFLMTWYSDGVGEVYDPYAEFGTAPL